MTRWWFQNALDIVYFHPENSGRWTHFEHIFQLGWFNGSTTQLGWKLRPLRPNQFSPSMLPNENRRSLDTEMFGHRGPKGVRLVERAGSDNDCWVLPDIATDCGNFRLRMSSDDSRIEFSNIYTLSSITTPLKPIANSLSFGTPLIWGFSSRQRQFFFLNPPSHLCIMTGQPFPRLTYPPKRLMRPYYIRAY